MWENRLSTVKHKEQKKLNAQTHKTQNIIYIRLKGTNCCLVILINSSTTGCTSGANLALIKLHQTNQLEVTRKHIHAFMSESQIILLSALWAWQNAFPGTHMEVFAGQHVMQTSSAVHVATWQATWLLKQVHTNRTGQLCLEVFLHCLWEDFRVQAS